jgi:hypothetical protein
MRAPLTRHDLRRHSRLAWASLGALLVTAAWFWLEGATGAALGTLGALAGCLGLILPPRERMRVLPPRLRALPRRCDAAPVLATLISCPGYGLGWFYGDNLYDEAVHLLNGGLAGAVLAVWLMLDGRPRRRRDLAAAGLKVGLAIAVGWEIFEWVTGLIGDTLDTVSDILLTTLGTALGAMLPARRRLAAGEGAAPLPVRPPRET